MGVEHDIEAAMEAAGADLRPRVLLIGFDVTGTNVNPICVEPETGALQPSHLAGVVADGIARYEADPESQIFHTYQPLHDARQHGLRRINRARALVSAIEASSTHPGQTFFASASNTVNGFDVHTCVSVDAAALAATPSLEGDRLDRMWLSRSLPIGIIEFALTLADRALESADAGQYLGVLGRSAAEIVREAGKRFAHSCLRRTGVRMVGELYDNLNAATSATYEGAAAHGRIILAKPEHPALDVQVKFGTEMTFRSTRAMRKLLELTDDDLALIANGTDIYALGTVADYQPQNQDLYEITVVDHATWQIHHDGTPLMKVAYGRPTLPKPLLTPGEVSTTLNRVFDGATVDVERLWASVSAASRAAHGTMFVISEDAASEALRLSSQAIRVEPKELDGDLVAHLSCIDGAVLVDPQGLCHAIGVILDGLATDEGDLSRGARFNSAIRYWRTAEAPTVIMIASEDGSVDLIPRLPARIRRATVPTAIAELRTAAAGDNGEDYAHAWHAVEALAFYLSQDECDEITAIDKAYWARSLEEGGLQLLRGPFKPSNDMNDSYFLD